MRSEDRVLESMKFKIALTDDFKVLTETTDITGRLVKQFVDVRARALEDAVRTQLIALGWAPPEEAKGMVAIDRVLAMMGAGATLQELCDWLLELKR